MLKSSSKPHWALLILIVFYSFLLSANPNPAGKKPDRINLTVSEDPSQSVGVTWRTDTTVKQSFIEYLVSRDDPAKISETQNILARTTMLISPDDGHKDQSWKGVAANYHSVKLIKLKPGTVYMYRVGAGDDWSEWFQFKTAKKEAEKFSFLFLGDAQTGLKSMWSRVIRAAYQKAPDALLMLHAGDLVNRATRDEEWGEWFEAGSFIHSSVMNMPSPGNHDYGRGEYEMVLSPFWQAQFTLPENGPKGFEGTCYYTDVQGVRFISIDSHRVEESEEDMKVQRDWLEEVLKTNTNPWVCVVFHHPIYSPKNTRDNTLMRENFKPLFDRYKVDLVLQGHDHTYARGKDKIPMENPGEISHTTYVVSVSGPKMASTGVEPKFWMDKSATHTQLYHVVTVEADRMEFRSYTPSGRLFDTFDLQKQVNAPNLLIER